MPVRGIGHFLAVLSLIFAGPAANAAPAGTSPVRVVVSFSILADIVRELGGAEVAVSSIVEPDGDAHVFEPSPDQVRMLAGAQLLVINGLGLEGWLDRLTRSAHYGGPVVVATEGISALATVELGNAKPSPDPHAWQNPRNVLVYADNIARALVNADPARTADYQQRLRHYKAAIETLDEHVREELAVIPEAKRRVITTHRAFAYYGAAYHVSFLAAEGVSTDSEPSAKVIAELIRQIRREGIKALFLENISDPRLIRELAKEAGAVPGTPLYSDALSWPDGPAPTYIRMIEHNTAALREGMLRN